MKPIVEMSRLELAAYIGAAFKEINVNVVLSGGSCVSIYSSEQYVSMDLDFVNAGFAKRHVISGVMTELGFYEENRYFYYPGCKFTVEFPSGPLGIGEEYAIQVDEITVETGSVRLLSPTDCVKDRLSWYFHANDLECLRQACLVASMNDVDLVNIEAWSKKEDKHDAFLAIREKLVFFSGESTENTERTEGGLQLGF